MKLSQRLETIASFVREGSKIADIGTDHGYLPIALTERGVVRSALAVDVRRGPLERADAHIREAGLTGRIETRLGDGLAALRPGEADCVIIAGMGGGLLVHILEAGRHMWGSVARWVLSPQSDIPEVRRYLLGHGFWIPREAMVREEGKYYTVIEALREDRGAKEGDGAGAEPNPAADGWSEADYCYGKYLIASGDPVLREYLEQERRTVSKILGELSRREIQSQRAAGRLRELRGMLALIEEVQYEMQ